MSGLEYRKAAPPDAASSENVQGLEVRLIELVRTYPAIMELLAAAQSLGLESKRFAERWPMLAIVPQQWSGN